MRNKSLIWDRRKPGVCPKCNSRGGSVLQVSILLYYFSITVTFNFPFLMILSICDYHVNPLPHPKRVCEGLGGLTLPDVPAFCLAKRPRWCVSISSHFLFPTVRAFVARTSDCSDSHCIGVPRRLDSSSFALFCVRSSPFARPVCR